AAKKLQAEASKIARLINEDFQAHAQQLELIRAKAPKLVPDSDDMDALTDGGDIPGESQEGGIPGGRVGGEGENKGGERFQHDFMVRNYEGVDRGQPVPTTPRERKPKTYFNVEFAD